MVKRQHRAFARIRRLDLKTNIRTENQYATTGLAIPLNIDEVGVQPGMMRDYYHAIRRQRSGQRCQFEPPGIFFSIVYAGAAPPPAMPEKQNAIVSGLDRSYCRPVIPLVPGRSVGPFLIVNPERIRPLRHGGAASSIYSMPNMLVTGARIDIE